MTTLLNRRLAAALLGSIITFAQTAIAESRVLCGASGAELQKWFDQMVAEQKRPVWIQACTHGGQVLFSAIAESETKPQPWLLRYDLSPADFQIAFDKYTQDGFQLLSWTGYLANKEDRLAAIWVKHDRGGRWQARNFLTDEEYQKRFDEALKAGQPPQQITHYVTSSGDRFAAIFETQPNLAFEARHNLTAARYQLLVNDMSEKGYRPTRASPRFSAIFVKDHLPWAAQHGLNQDEMNAKLKGYEQSGYDPICIAAYTDQNKVAYAAVWKQSELPEVAPTGNLPASFEPLDTAVRDFMKEHRIPCGTLAVQYGGQLKLSRGYGYATRDRSRQVQPDDLFRIASVSKPITACLVRKLAQEGRLDLNAPAFELIGAQPLPGQQVDPRIKQITVEHLLTHQGGWVRGTTFDPMFRALEVAKELDRPAPATADDVIQYMLGQPLQFDPGMHTGKASERYSNFGYCVLGRVVEQVTGTTYMEALQSELLGPLGIQDMLLGRTLPQFRNPREPYYADSSLARSVFVAQKEELVPWPDGGFHLEAMDSHGGLIASAPALVRLFEHYWSNGQPRGAEDLPQEWFSVGSLDGTAALLLQHDGIDIAVLLNQRIASEDNQKLANAIKDALSGIEP
jgi:CubicO group peptidase (beta-lactamase class C family)